MSSELDTSIRRREFLKKAGAASALSLVDLRLDASNGRIVIVADKYRSACWKPASAMGARRTTEGNRIPAYAGGRYQFAWSRRATGVFISS